MGPSGLLLGPSVLQMGPNGLLLGASGLMYLTLCVTLARCSLICGVVLCCSRLVVAEPVKRDIHSQPQYNVVKTNFIIIK